MTLDLKSTFANVGSSLPVAYELDLSKIEYSGGFPLKKPVTVGGSASNQAGLVALKLVINYEFSAPCDRCGVNAVHTHTVTVDKALAVSIEGEDSDTILTVPDMKLDVDELVYTEVYVDLPTKHLCRKDCKGICPQCGKNLNQGDCGCSGKEIDPRLAKLADLLR